MAAIDSKSNLTKSSYETDFFDSGLCPPEIVWKSLKVREKKRAQHISILFVILFYLTISLLVSLLTARSGIYPAGSDTMFYVYRGDLMYNSIKNDGNWFPLIDPQWYNGVQSFRYWSPLSSWILAGCQALAGGSSFDGYLIFVGLMYFFCAIPWMYIGYRHDRPVLGSVIGAIWFFVPNNLFMLYAEGVLARSISMTVMPIFIVAIYDYLKDGSWKKLITIILSFIFIIMCHVGWAGMVLISVAIFFLFYYILNRKALHGTHRILSVAVCCALSMVICGIWVVPSLIGGITGIDSSSIMANFFQPLLKSISPISVSSSGIVNRWNDPAVNLSPYFGCAAFILGIIGALLSKRETSPGFLTAISVCLLTTTAAYPILLLLPGSQYLWMLRFISIALAFLFVSLFFWRTLKKVILNAVIIMLCIESCLAVGIITGDGTYAGPQIRYEVLSEKTLVNIGKPLTRQRFSRIEGKVSDPDTNYAIFGYDYNEIAVPTSYGQGIQAASTYHNVIQLNEAEEQKCYLYVFDRALELGNDTVLVPIVNDSDSFVKATASVDEIVRGKNMDNHNKSVLNGTNNESVEDETLIQMSVGNNQSSANTSTNVQNDFVVQKKKHIRYIAIPFIIVVYALIGMLVSFFTMRSGTYPSGADTMFYVYRGDMMYNSIKDSGNWFPLIDPQWYNGVQSFRYWSPLSSWILAGCQALAGGSSFSGYLIFVGLLYLFNALSWLYIGYKHNRPVLGTFIGLIWFFIPNNLFMLFTEGVLARSLSMPVLPILLVNIYDYLKDGNWRRLIVIILSFVYIIMCHTGWAGMIVIALSIFFLFYYILNRKSLCGSHRIFCIYITVVFAFAITGIWLVASLKGGITTKSSESIMASYFQSLNLTLNPFYGLSGNTLNRWKDPVASSGAYFGLGTFILGIVGIFVSRRKTSPAFATAISICLLTSSTAYPFLAILPGSQYLWMLRFISIALTFLLVGFFYWDSLKKWIQIVFSIVLVIQCFNANILFTSYGTWTKPEERYDSIANSTFIDIGKSLTSQRMSCIEPYESILESIYIIAGYGYKDNTVPTSYGQGIQSAATFSNIVQLNESSEQQSHLYTFDRSLELGNDMVLLPVCNFENNSKPIDINEIDYAARKSGYNLIESNDKYRLYHLDDDLLEGIDKNFGVISKYRGIGIGRSASTISIDFPMVEETVSYCINDYTYEQLSQYDIVFLAGFTYTDKPAAEEMLIKLSENGTRIVIMADGIPSDEHTGSRAFLGLECYPIRFKNGYPELDTIDGYLNCDLFPAGYTDWLTVYVNGLDEVWGTVDDFEQNLPFYGTVKNDNIVVIGLNLSYHYALTKDPTVGALLSHAYRVNAYELPEREIVPLQIDYYNDRIEIVSDYDDVCTTLAWHDIFEPDNGAYTKNHLTFVNKGKTVIKLHYPYFWQGLAVTVFGIVVTIFFILNAKKRWEKEHPDPDDCAELKDSEEPDESQVQSEEESTSEHNPADDEPKSESEPEDKTPE